MMKKIYKKVFENLAFILMGIIYFCVYSQSKFTVLFAGLVIGIGLRGIYEILIIKLLNCKKLRNRGEKTVL